jgi:hypothetical protein
MVKMPDMLDIRVKQYHFALLEGHGGSIANHLYPSATDDIVQFPSGLAMPSDLLFRLQNNVVKVKTAHNVGKDTTNISDNSANERQILIVPLQPQIDLTYDDKQLLGFKAQI